jgi:hypothetical protein
MNSESIIAVLLRECEVMAEKLRQARQGSEEARAWIRGKCHLVPYEGLRWCLRMEPLFVAWEEEAEEPPEEIPF